MGRVRVTIVSGGNTLMLFVCFVELRVAVNYIKMLSLAQQCFCGKFMLQAAIKRI